MCSHISNCDNIANTTTLCLQDWQRDNKYLRLDSEYQRLEILNIIEKLKEHGVQQLKDDNLNIIHPKEIERKYVGNEDAGTWFLRAQNVRPMRIDEGNRVFISLEDAECLKDNNLRNGDVLITRSGANRGDSAVFNSTTEAIASSHTLVVRTNMITPEILVGFLNSKFGKPQIERGVYGAAQPEVSPYYLKNIWIPKFSGRFEIKIKEAFFYSERLREQAKKYLAAADKSIETALGIDSCDLLPSLAYISDFTSVKKSYRLDAQYFMPTKAKIKEQLSKKNTLLLSDLVQERGEKIDPQKLPPHLEVVNFDVGDAVGGYLAEDKNPVTKENIGSIKKHIYPNDIIISRIGCYLKQIAVVQETCDYPLIASSEFYVLTPNQSRLLNVTPETLMVFLRSSAVQTILKHSQTGTSHPRFALPDLLSIPVPEILEDYSEKVTSLVVSSIESLKLSNTILQKAVSAIETAIEISEEKGLVKLSKFLEANDASS